MNRLLSANALALLVLALSQTYVSQTPSTSDIFQFARKTANEDVTSNTTLQNDDHLTLNVRAGEVWTGRLVVLYDGADTAAGDIKYGMTGPTGSALLWTGVTLPTAATAFFGQGMDAIANGSASGTVNTTFNGGLPLLLDVEIVNGSTAGAWTFQWAQNTSSTTRTRVRVNSFFRAQRH